jgi:hypothetical protein
LPDFIDTFMDLTASVRSPPAFRLWAAIAIISSTLERRVWTETDVDPLRPNLFVVLAGQPASGKGNAIREARKLLTTLIEPESGIHIGPDNPTSASFLDALAASTKMSINGLGTPMYSALTVLCRELGSLITKYEGQFAANLADIYDNPSNFSAPRRQSKSVNVAAPTINILAAATPSALMDIIPESAWDQGLTSRMIFIYGVAPTSYRDPFKKRKEIAMENLAADLKTFFHELHGEFEWEEPAQDALKHWLNDENMAPKPSYGRLVHYVGRRNEHVMKLSMISAVSAGHGLCVTLEDFRRAQRWMFEAEKTMPDVFRAMTQKSDSQVLEDVHQIAWIQYTTLQRDKRQALSDTDIWKILENRSTSERIPYLIKSLESTGRLRKAGIMGGWVPNPPHDFRIEDEV